MMIPPTYCYDDLNWNRYLNKYICFFLKQQSSKQNTVGIWKQQQSKQDNQFNTIQVKIIFTKNCFRETPTIKFTLMPVLDIMQTFCVETNVNELNRIVSSFALDLAHETLSNLLL